MRLPSAALHAGLAWIHQELGLQAACALHMTVCALAALQLMLAGSRGILLCSGTLPAPAGSSNLLVLTATQTGLENSPNYRNSRGEQLPEHLMFDRCAAASTACLPAFVRCVLLKSPECGLPGWLPTTTKASCS